MGKCDKEIDVSIILPSLNVEPYIRECVESVLGQTLKNIEILCIDAGSTDGTLEILKEYAKQDSRIKLLQSEKRSYGYQMNLGIRLARGKYIGIVETDDLVDSYMFGDLYAIAEEKNLDFIKADAYHFTVKRDGEKIKKYTSIIEKSEYRRFYNKVLCPNENLQVYTFIVNTWSGIYSRRFLLDNQIWHNESEGAAFQDTGFWFQTFMYAKRVLFLDKAYYMYRRDNPNSSIYQRGKVYAICEEYDFLKRILKQDSVKFKFLQYVYSKARFDICFFNLGRISEEYQLEFCEKIGRDFAKALEMGEIDKSLFLQEHWEALEIMARGPAQYYDSMTQEWDSLLEKLKTFECVILYGAGNIGKQTFNRLTYGDTPIPVMCFAVTEKRDGASDFLGVPVYGIEDLQMYRERAAVLIAAAEIHQQNITDTLKQLGFQHIFYRPILQTEVLQEENADWIEKCVLEKGKERILTPVGFQEYIAEQYGRSCLPKLYGSWERFEDIDFDVLPNAFVLGFSHTKELERFVPDKENKDYMDLVFFRERVSCILKKSMEKPFQNVPKAIWAREFVGDFSESCVVYRLLCINEHVKSICVEWRDFQTEGYNTKRDFYDCNWNLLDMEVKYPLSGRSGKKPDGLENILYMAEKLSKGFAQLVVDYMYHNEKWYAMGASLQLDDISEKRVVCLSELLENA